MFACHCSLDLVFFLMNSSTHLLNRRREYINFIVTYKFIEGDIIEIPEPEYERKKTYFFE